MIPEPGDTNHEVPVNETFHVQTDDELTEKELKQIEADDQAIQTILLGLPEDIYVAVDSCETAQEIWQIAQPGMNMGQDIQMRMVEGNGENQFRQYVGENVGSLNGYNAVQNVKNQARAEGNAIGYNGNQIRCYNYRGVGHFARNCTARPRRRDAAYLQTQLLIAQKEEAGIQLQAEEFDLMAAVADLDEIEEVNANCILMANLHQASTSGTQTNKALVYDSDGSTKALELEIEHLLRAVVSQDIMSVVQNNSVGETSNLQIELERMKERFENCIIKKENEYAKLWNDRYKKCEECKFDKNSYDKAYNDMQQKIERLQAQLGDLKGKSNDSSCVSDTLIPLSQKLENENVELEFQLRAQLFNKVSDQKDNTRGTCANTKFAKQSIVRNLPKIGIDNTKTRRLQPRSNTKNDRVPSVSKSSYNKNKGVEVEEPHRNLLLSKNKKHMSSACNNVKIDSPYVKYKFVCAMCKQCLISVNHDVCLLNFVNGKTSRGKKQKANVSISEKQKKQLPKVKKTKKVGFIKRLATPKPRQFYDSDLEDAFRRNACFVRNLEGVDLLSGNRTTNLYTINLHDMASASPICLMARASSTKSWLWHQRLSHLNFDTINDLAKNDLVSGLPKFKYEGYVIYTNTQEMG
nr:integrase, catalytic region, zinc finger, CCHC-type, peptidase aspartic, catalytic [Tanacetum cinerariifolium]